MGIKVKPLAEMLIVAGSAIWLSIGIMIRDSIFEIIAVKSVIYLDACVSMGLALLRSDAARLF